jgi:hypothetical protein
MLVGVVVLRGGAHGEGGHLVEEKIQTVVVVEHHDHVRLLLVQPLVDGRKAVEEGFPVRFLLQTLVDRAADRGNVGRAEASDELCHE